MAHLDSTENNKIYILLGVIILLALSLRLWGNWFGLPHIYHTDEWKEVKRALQLGTGFFDFRRIEKGGYFYLLFLEYGIFFLIAKIWGVINSSNEFLYRFFFENPTELWLIGRVTTGIIGTLNVYFVYLLGKKAHSAKTGVLSALFLAFAFLHAKHSHYITVDVPLTCLLTITFYYIVCMVQAGRLKDYLLSAVFAALAAMTKLPGVVVVISIVTAHVYNILKENKPFRQIITEKRIVLCALTFILLYSLGTPGIIFHLEEMLRGNLSLLIPGVVSSVDTKTIVNVFPQKTNNPWLFYLSALRDSFGALLLVVSIVGLGYGFIKRTREDIVLIPFCLIFYFLCASSKNPELIYARYILPVVPLLAVLAARFLWEKVFNWPVLTNKKILIVAIASLVMISEPTYRLIKNNQLMTKKDTRTLAKEWMEKNISPGAKILSDNCSFLHVNGTLPLSIKPEALKQIVKYDELDGLKKSFYDMRIKSLKQQATYNLVSAGTEDAPWNTLDIFIGHGIQYVVVRSEFMRKFLSGINRKRFPMVGAFYKELKNSSKVALLESFDPDSLNAYGPAIEIYKVKNVSK